MKYQVYRDNAGQYRWRLRAINGRTIADSAEGYINRTDCVAGITLVKQSSLAPIEG